MNKWLQLNQLAQLQEIESDYLNYCSRVVSIDLD